MTNKDNTNGEDNRYEAVSCTFIARERERERELIHLVDVEQRCQTADDPQAKPTDLQWPWVHLWAGIVYAYRRDLLLLYSFLFTITGRQRNTEYSTEVNRQAENRQRKYTKITPYITISIHYILTWIGLARLRKPTVYPRPILQTKRYCSAVSYALLNFQ